MATPNWLNQNMGRSFPFLAGSVDRKTTVPENAKTLMHLPDSVIVDAGFVMGPMSGFDPKVHSIYLERILRDGDGFLFEFSSDAPELFGVSLLFFRKITDPIYALEYIDEPTDSSSSDSAPNTADTQSASSVSSIREGCGEPLWWGYLVTGSMTDLDDWMGGLTEVVRGGTSTTVEPALIRNMSSSFIRSINLANDDRTRVTSPAGCNDVIWPFETGQTRLQADCLVGDVIIQEGYNVSIRQNDTTNTITFSATVGAGEGEPCSEIKRFPEDAPPIGSSFLTGGPSCSDVVRSINGKGGRYYRILNGFGVRVTEAPEEHKITLDVDMTGLAVCFSDLSEVSESLSVST